MSEPGPNTPRRKLPYVNTFPRAFLMRMSFLGSLAFATRLTNSLQMCCRDSRTLYLRSGQHSHTAHYATSGEACNAPFLCVRRALECLLTSQLFNQRIAASLLGLGRKRQGQRRRHAVDPVAGHGRGFEESGVAAMGERACACVRARAAVMVSGSKRSRLVGSGRRGCDSQREKNQ